MLQEIKDLQYNAVTALYNKVEQQHEVTFKAPTGSGKTFMMADLMNRYLNRPNIVFIVSSLSKAGLGKQNYDNFVKFQDQFPNINPYLIKSDFAEDEKIYIPDTYNVYVLPRDLYKDKARIKTSGAFLNLLISLKFKGSSIYLIKDECHIATSNLDELNDEFEKIINLSATPRFVPDIEITNEEAVRVKLIKKLAEESESDRTIYTVNPKDGIKEAVNKFLAIKDLYINKLKVNPCLIIQISNKDKADQEWARIKKIINDPNKNLKWMYIVDDKNGKGCDTNDTIKKLPVHKWKDYVKSNESLIDIIVFKMVITEGWDIPRACMLYQVRDSKSKMMDEQVVGRVRRNPILLNWEQFDEEAHKLALVSWVWGLVDGSLRKFKNVHLVERRNIEVKTTKLKSLEKCNKFDLKEYISTRNSSMNLMTIFDLYHKWTKVSDETSNLCWNEVESYEDWMTFAKNIDEIERENTAYMSNYEESMENDITASLQKNSFFEVTGNITEISDWAWKLNGDDDEYHFDSEAEKEFAKILKKLNTKYWGKNYYPNSNIKFEYVLYNKHSSYPDFVLKDKKNNIHIFEVKSVNRGGGFSFDEEDYLKKIEALKKMFITASKITKQYFYIPIKKNDDWVIYKMFDGNEETLTKDSFINFIKALL